MREPGRQEQRKKNCDAGEDHRLLQAWSQFIFQKDRRYAHPDAAKAGAVKLQWNAHVIHGGRVVHHAKLPAKVRVLHQVEVGPVGNFLPHQIGIGVQNGFAVAIDDGRVVNDGPAPHHRFQKIIQIAVGAQVVRDRPAHGLGIGGVHLGAAQIGGGVRGQVRQVGSQLSCGFSGRGDALAQQFRDVDIGKCRDQHGHHEGDGEHDFGFSPHGLPKSAFSP